jgi:hypothetical protein
MAVESMMETLSGMQNVERAIIGAVRARGVNLSAQDFSWNRGRSLAELPDVIHMEVSAGAKRAAVDWQRIQLENSTLRIDRLDVLQPIDQVVGILTSP